MNEQDKNNSQKALWIFPNFKETVDSIPKKHRGRVYEILINHAFGEFENFSNENKYIQIAVKSLLPLIKLRNKGGSKDGRSNNPTGKSKKNETDKNEANIGANVGPNIGPNVGAIPYKQEQEQEHKQENKNKQEKPKDIFCNPDFEKCFNMYSDICKKLIPLRFERRSKAILEQLSLFLNEIEYNFDYFKELCTKANELEKIVETKIDFKMMINNHSGIMNDKYKKPKVEIKWDY